MAEVEAEYAAANRQPQQLASPWSLPPQFSLQALQTMFGVGTATPGVPSTGFSGFPGTAFVAGATSQDPMTREDWRALMASTVAEEITKALPLIAQSASASASASTAPGHPSTGRRFTKDDMQAHHRDGFNKGVASERDKAMAFVHQQQRAMEETRAQDSLATKEMQESLTSLSVELEKCYANLSNMQTDKAGLEEQLKQERQRNLQLQEACRQAEARARDLEAETKEAKDTAEYCETSLEVAQNALFSLRKTLAEAGQTATKGLGPSSEQNLDPSLKLLLHDPMEEGIAAGTPYSELGRLITFQSLEEEFSKDH